MDNSSNNEQPEEQKPSLQSEPERGGNGSGRPPKPTAIGTGGSDDDWRPNSYDLDQPDRHIPDWNVLESRPIEGFKFISLDPVPRPTESNKEDLSSLYRTSMQEDSKLSSWLSLTESKLDELHEMGVSIAYFLHGSRTRCSEYIGIANPETAGDHSTLTEELLQDIRRFRIKVTKTNEFATKLISSDEIQELIKPICVYVSLSTGLPWWVLSQMAKEFARDENATDTEAYQGHSRFAAGLHGQDYGLLTIAKPISVETRAVQIFALSRSIQEAEQIEDPQIKRRKKYLLESQYSCLNFLEENKSKAAWSFCCYSFCRDASVRARASALLQTRFPAPKITRISTILGDQKENGLKQSIRQFGLIQSKPDFSTVSAYEDYPFLLPMTSRALTAYFPLCISDPH